jgi:hypothetical protein
MFDLPLIDLIAVGELLLLFLLLVLFLLLLLALLALAVVFSALVLLLLLSVRPCCNGLASFPMPLAAILFRATGIRRAASRAKNNTTPGQQ